MYKRNDKILFPTIRRKAQQTNFFSIFFSGEKKKHTHLTVLKSNFNQIEIRVTDCAIQLEEILWFRSENLHEISLKPFCYHEKTIEMISIHGVCWSICQKNTPPFHYSISFEKKTLLISNQKYVYVHYWHTLTFFLLTMWHSAQLYVSMR